MVHVDGSPDPTRDIEVIQTELILSDLEQVERKLERLRKQAKGNREAAAAIPVFEKMLAHLGDGKLARSGDWATEELVIFAELSRSPVSLALHRQCLRRGTERGFRV